MRVFEIFQVVAEGGGGGNFFSGSNSVFGGKDTS